MATYDGTDPIPQLSTALTNAVVGVAAYGGGILRVPPIAGVYQLKGMSYYPPENISSEFSTLRINISTRKEWGVGLSLVAGLFLCVLCLVLHQRCWVTTGTSFNC
jgi:hypothetical protein